MVTVVSLPLSQKKRDIIVQKISKILKAVLELLRFRQTGLLTWDLHFMGPKKDYQSGLTMLYAY